MKHTIYIGIFFFCLMAMNACKTKKEAELISEEKRYLGSIEEYQAQKNADYEDEAKSPLTAEDRANFKGLPFFPINKKYSVQADFKLSEGEKPFQMPTTGPRKPNYIKFAEATFSLEGEIHTLSIYRNLDLMRMPQYKDYLFLPFTDLTNGKSSYGGGRYLDLRIPKGDRITLDFNKAYNPYCAYNTGYSCPIPPKENKLDIAIEAGVKYDSEK